MSIRVWWAGALLALSPLSAAVAHAAEVNAVASFTVLADVVEEVGGDRVAVTSLIGPNGDPHAYEPTPDDVRQVRQADVVFMSGLGLEGWMGRLIEASGYQGQPVVVSDGIHTREMGEDAHEHGHDDADGDHAGGSHDGADPHVWNSPTNIEVWVDNIVTSLSNADPAGADVYRANGDAYKQELASLDQYAREQIDALPEHQRKVLTSHDAFGYFADRYGVTFLSPLGMTTDSEASAKDVASMIRQMRDEHIRSYFFENSNDPRLVEQIARATDAQPGGELYVESLSEVDGDAPTYADMFRFNVDQLVQAMKKNR